MLKIGIIIHNDYNDIITGEMARTYEGYCAIYDDAYSKRLVTHRSGIRRLTEADALLDAEREKRDLETTAYANSL